MRVRRLLKTLACLAAVLAVACFTLFSGALYTYSVLTDEALVAELHFRELGPQHFEASLVTDDGCRLRTVEIYGDQWRLDAQFLKWHNWALLLGLDAHYRLSRIEGRYASIEDQNTLRNLAWALEDESSANIIDLAAGMGRWNVLVDSTYGSSAYLDIDPDTDYRVFRTQTGLIARTEPRRENVRRDDALVVEIRSGCGVEAGWWQRFSMWVDRSLGEVM